MQSLAAVSLRALTQSPARPRFPAILFATMLLVPIAGTLVARAVDSAPPRPCGGHGVRSRGRTTAARGGLGPGDRGRILDADGNTVNGAAVRLVSPSVPYTVFSDTKSDAAGRFSFAHVGS